MKNIPPIRLGIIGLGRAFVLMREAFSQDHRVRLVAAFDPREEARNAFAQEFGGMSCTNAQDVCAHADTELIYIASPHEFHREHVLLAARYKKHVVVEKPLALNGADARTMVDACEASGSSLLVAHSHGFDPPIDCAADLIANGEIGAVQHVLALNYTDFVYRPRRAAELASAQHGVVFAQGAHQIDCVRRLVGGSVTSVRAQLGDYDSARPIIGAYSAQLLFDSGATADVIYNGYGGFNSDVWCDELSEMGDLSNPKAFADTRAAFLADTDEVARKDARGYGTSSVPVVQTSAPLSCEHFGPMIVTGSAGAIRVGPSVVSVFTAKGTRAVKIDPPTIRRQNIVDVIVSTVRLCSPPRMSGRWCIETIDACAAMVTSHKTKTTVQL